MSIYVETERLILRQFTVNDLEELHAICSQPYILKWMPDWKVSIEERKEWISWVGEQYAKSTKNTARIMLAVTLKSDRKLIGMVGIGNKEEVNNEIEIAFFISEEFSNNGYISEASMAMTEWVFANLKLDYLIAIVELDNISSQRVVEKSGFANLETKWILNSGETEEKPFYYYRIYNRNL
ncbi:GNAT family N-acetyltransferase [Alkaliphilus peptidifermentans]|uniref:Protein N-acetyltransferase, RimJ/RimL family n=1 Tax=Alkaliphilus peptidifermentans DSM 18978 TaxID=1120976 RepID=A0A1G5LH87_9FIRM|nr:GNAT family N-acetyltransferase [Alkaliphilus peptidifermentans]SCZ11590.1 Protein N-acetyltransferase, RimJ/RimL family [Alkaliphilus peptidifermentans DSM 18978]